MFYSFSLIMALSILSLNCNGLRDQPERLGLVQWLRSLLSTVNVVCLQEAHCVSDAECRSQFPSLGYGFVLYPGSVHSHGCFVPSWCFACKFLV